MKSNGNRYSPAFKFRVVLEALKAEGKGGEAQVARAYGVHPVILAKWKRHFLEHGAEVFGGKEEIKAYELLSLGHEQLYCESSESWVVSPRSSIPNDGI
mgnify:CR=1 FL=1